MTVSASAVANPIDAATVVVVRDTRQGLEVLMLRKHSKVHFGGMWVFPGGRVDEADRVGAADTLHAFRRAAVREAEEEAAIELDDGALLHLSHWMPPARRTKRFSTHFFLTSAPPTAVDIAVDGREIDDHRWMTPQAALLHRHRGEIEFVTPTFVTLNWLRQFTRVADAMAEIRGPVCFHTRLIETDAGSIAVYDGDVAYDSLDLQRPGARRRANMLHTGWWWEEHDGCGNGPWPLPMDFTL